MSEWAVCARWIGLIRCSADQFSSQIALVSGCEGRAARAQPNASISSGVTSADLAASTARSHSDTSGPLSGSFQMSQASTRRSLANAETIPDT